MGLLPPIIPDVTSFGLDILTRALYRGDISLTRWAFGVATELKDIHIAQAVRGAQERLTVAGRLRVGLNLADEYRHLYDFARDIAAGKVSEAQALNRARQYGQAAQQAYWREHEAATPRGTMIYWDLNPGENCSGCIALAAGSPYKPGELHTVPGGGSTPCYGSCNCSLRRESQ